MKMGIDFNLMLTDLEKMKEKVNIDLASCPDGWLVQSKRGGKTYYLWAVKEENGKIRRKGIARRPEILPQLMRKKFLETEALILEKDIKALKRFISEYVEPTTDNILDNIPKRYRRMPEELFFRYAGNTAGYCGVRENYYTSNIQKAKNMFEVAGEHNVGAVLLENGAGARERKEVLGEAKEKNVPGTPDGHKESGRKNAGCGGGKQKEYREERSKCKEIKIQEAISGRDAQMNYDGVWKMDGVEEWREPRYNEDINDEEWMANPYEISLYRTEERRHTTSRGLKVRSKTEVLIAEKLYEFKLPFHYEEVLHIGEKTVVPDFTVRVRGGKRFYWEHCGLMNNEDYKWRHKKKLELYEAAGIVPWKNLIVTYDNDEGSINLAVIESEIRNKLL